jgi:hypothetical protein
MILAIAAILAGPSLASAQLINASFNTPNLDRWMYPFGATPGIEAEARLFGTTTDPVFVTVFDNRDGQMYVKYDTAPTIPAGLDPSRYVITSVRLTLQVSQDDTFIYDNTVDPFGTFLLDPKDPDFEEDTDPGQPIELFGSGYRYGFTPASFAENGPFSFGSPLAKSVRAVYALSYDETGEAVDVSNNVDEHWTPEPWAIGIIDGLAPGSSVPIESLITFDLNLENADVEAYLQDALSDGIVPLTVTSLYKTAMKVGTVPFIYTKENPLVLAEVSSPAKLEITVEILDCIAEDLDCDGDVDGFDLAILLAAWGKCNDPENCPEDLDGNGVVNGFDLAMLLAAWDPS